ncbi:hypothetical protein [Litchfieldia salsa]|uniref:Uncharacterized protein n=1 Tax=Litchfieldia salsa TaxID=930152 RepID=A0A1H0X022_9BACI|nr:hypothetical protein [Litchfieldia salsa]SDP96262.1 hypothetical protein SAMN05216565_1217 [Litchfieldia salsa]
MSEDIDVVIKEINQYFTELNFNKVVINGRENFEFKGGYYSLSKADNYGYFLEYAKTLDEAKNNCYEDIEAYSGGFKTEELTGIIKNDIKKFVVGAEGD